MTTQTQKLAVPPCHGCPTPSGCHESRFCQERSPFHRLKPYAWPGPGPEPARWTHADGTIVYRDYESYCMD